ncbi:MAG TPA: cytochrome c [Aestuariivirga sp.]|nr:cytochrome c [Aestuariivirga sp.]
MLGFTAFWLVSAPRPLPASAIPAHAGNIANGEILYTAGGCRNCHKPNAEQAGLDPDLPSGGFPLKTPIGVLYPPNLTPDAETGIGNWSDLDFVNAVQRGISTSGQHLIPAFPYTSYAAMPVEDVLDIKAYLMSLPPVSSPSREAEIPIALLLRRGLGLWKFLGLDTAPWQPDSSQTATWNRGSYLVNGPGHCGECHTPRNLIMARDDSRFMMGGPHPEGQGKVPSLHGLVETGRYKDQKDLVLALQNGEVFGYENMSSGGMGQVQANMAKLPQADVEAIAEYLISLK